MNDQVYKDMVEVMIKRGGAFSGLDIPEFYALVCELFTPGEAELNNQMPRGPFTAEKMAEITGRDASEVEQTLEAMANKGLCAALTLGGTTFYQSARFMPGIFEFQFMPGNSTEREKRLARLIHAYKRAYKQHVAPHKSAGFPANRVITVERTIAPQSRVHTYDQIQTFIDQNDHISVSTCYCRHAAELRGEDTHGMPKDVCMQFGMGAQYAIERLNARKVTQQEARQVLEKAEEAGLIHMSANTADDIGYICNCDRWHCVVVADLLTKSKPGLLFNSGFQPQLDAAKCAACATCIHRCPSEALTMGSDDHPAIDLDRCFGCAVCATGCPNSAIVMSPRPGFPEPPKDAKALKEAMRAHL